uniref:SUEL-type lectin domain-containing protein n=1 Tax=Xiphophorus maculatus TaxID=8083 RepID=A0A3B5Q4X1_XIPMA
MTLETPASSRNYYLFPSCCLWADEVGHVVFVWSCDGDAVHCGMFDRSRDIFVISATYGRSNRMTCSVGIPAEQTKNTNCATRAESVFQKCEGRSTCNVLASNSVFGDPCVGTYKYLDVIYLC